MICHFCRYEYPDQCGRYGCPNCEGTGLNETEEGTMSLTSKSLARAAAAGVRVLSITSFNVGPRSYDVYEDGHLLAANVNADHADQARSIAIEQRIGSDA